MAQFDEQIALIRSGLDDYQIPMVALLLWTEEEFQTKVHTTTSSISGRI